MASGSQNMTTDKARQAFYLEAPNEYGYYTDEYGNLIYKYVSEPDAPSRGYLNLNNNDKTIKLRYYWETGDVWVPGKVGIGYNPTTSDNTHKLYVNGTSYFTNAAYFGNGTTYYISANGSQYTGSAAKWTNARTLTIGGTGKSVDGSADVSWSMNDIMGSSDSSKFYRGDKTWSNTLNGVLLLPQGLKTGGRASGSGSGIEISTAGGIEIFNSSTPFIDFHYQASTADYSIRLICKSATELKCTTNFTAAGSIYADGGYLKSTLNSNTVTIGSANTSWCHIENSANIPFYFNKAIHVNGDIYYYNTKVHMSSSGFHPPKNGGIYWDPYVESASDASDVTQIIQIAGGVAGGTELRIQQANDATDIINLVTPKSIYLNSKEAFNVSDAWLRINENKKFTSGVYFGSSVVRTDGEFWSDSVRIVDNWVGFYNAVQGGTRYGYIQANANRMYFCKENGVSTYHFDFGGHIYTPNNVYAHGIWANQTDGEKQVGVDNGTAGNLYLWSNNSEKGIYSGTGYRTGYIIRCTSSATTFYGNCTGSAGSVAWANTGHPSTFPPSAHTHAISDISWGAAQNLSCSGTNTEWSIDMNGSGSYWHVWSNTQGTTLACYQSNGHVNIPIHLYVGGYNNTSYGLSASSIACNGNLYVSASNTTGGGIILSDDGDIVDLNDGYCAMRFSSGVRIFSANKGGSAVITLYSSGHLYASGELMAPKHLRIGSTILRDDGADVYFLIGTRNTAGDNWNGLRPFRFNLSNGVVWFGHGAYGAVWNDFAEFRKSSYKQAGHTVVEDGYGCLKLCQERLAAGARVISDTFGMAVGQSLEQDTPIGIGGRVLAYTFQNRNNFKVGDAVCAAPNGTIDLMTREEIKEYPDRIIGIVSEIPQYETWTQQGTKDMEPVKVKVNNRIWIYVR